MPMPARFQFSVLTALTVNCCKPLIDASYTQKSSIPQQHAYRCNPNSQGCMSGLSGI